MYKFTLIVFLLAALSITARAQQQIDTTGKKSKTDKKLQAKLDSAKENPIVPKPKVRIYNPDTNHSPHKAIMHSLMIPGWGQLYNHQIWKVPIIYGGLTGLAIYYIYNRNTYNLYLKIAQDREKGIAPAPTAKEFYYYSLYAQYGVGTDVIDNIVTEYKRYEEIGVFAFVAAWGIQVIDAYIEAKFQHSYAID